MSDDRQCPDSGTCFHNCIEPLCWRVDNAAPLTIAGWGNKWPETVKAAHGMNAPLAEETFTEQLAMMLHTQRMLQIESFGIDPAEADFKERVEYIRWNVLALTDELHELLGETSWKPWTTATFIHSEAAFKEWIDAWHFMMNIVWAIVGLGTYGDANVLADEITSAYMAKKQRNAERQREGYTGEVGGAAHDAAHVEQ